MNWCTKFELDRYSSSKATAEIRFAHKTRWLPKNIPFPFCHFITNWCTKFEQDRYSRSKATVEIRFAQKVRWPPKNIFFIFSFYNELVYQI